MSVMERFAVSTSRSFLRENSAMTVKRGELSSGPAYFALVSRYNRGFRRIFDEKLYRRSRHSLGYPLEFL